MTAEPSGDEKTLKVLQFTDTHFFKDASGTLLGVDTSASFSEVFKTASSSRGTPDFYLLTGDLSQDETQESYKRLTQALSLAGAPCYFLPGNHDKREDMTRGLIHESSPFNSSRQIIRGKWQVILLDSQVEGEVGGRLDKAELDFLKKCLSEHPELHALVCLHHHPVPMGARWLDQIGVENGKEFLEILDEYPSVRAVVWGHVHQEFNGRHKKMLLMATPSTCVQFKAKSDEFGVDPVPPGYRWLELDPDGTIRSGVSRTDKVSGGLELSSAGY